jgi:hypothetical protein
MIFSGACFLGSDILTVSLLLNEANEASSFYVGPQFCLRYHVDTGHSWPQHGELSSVSDAFCDVIIFRQFLIAKQICCR